MKVDVEREFGDTGEVQYEYENVHDDDGNPPNDDSANLKNLKEDVKITEFFNLLRDTYGAFNHDEEIYQALKNGVIYVDPNDAVRVLNTGIAIVGRVDTVTLNKLIHELNHPGATSSRPTDVPFDPVSTRHAETMAAISNPVEFSAEIQNPRQRGERRPLSGAVAATKDKGTEKALAKGSKSEDKEPKPLVNPTPAADTSPPADTSSLSPASTGKGDTLKAENAPTPDEGKDSGTVPASSPQANPKIK